MLFARRDPPPSFSRSENETPGQDEYIVLWDFVKEKKRSVLIRGYLMSEVTDDMLNMSNPDR